MTSQDTFHLGDLVGLKLQIRKINEIQAASDLCLEMDQLSALLAGTKRIDLEIALRLSKILGGSPDEWMSHQTEFDLQNNNYQGIDHP